LAKIEPFERYYLRYDDWFKENRFAYLSEVDALRRFIPKGEEGVEIGIGSGRFALALGIRFGLDPSLRMLSLARKRGLKVLRGIAENLPFKNNSFDFALIVTTICFVDSPETSLKETYRILKPKGQIVVGFIDKNSSLGRFYMNERKSPFYSYANFYSVQEIFSLLRNSGFKNLKALQTIFHPLSEIKCKEPVREGYGQGSFVVVRGIK